MSILGLLDRKPWQLSCTLYSAILKAFSQMTSVIFPKPLCSMRHLGEILLFPLLQRRYLKSLAQGAYYKAILLGVGGLLLSFSHCPTDFFILSVSTPIKESVRPSPEPLSQETKDEGKPLFLVLTSREK